MWQLDMKQDFEKVGLWLRSCATPCMDHADDSDQQGPSCAFETLPSIEQKSIYLIMPIQDVTSTTPSVLADEGAPLPDWSADGRS